MTAAGGLDPAAEVVERWLRCWAAEVTAARDWLTGLDAAIGDGDHGINLERGLRAVVLDLDDAGARPPASAPAGHPLSAAGRRLMGVVGGASGALYGRALVRAGEALGSAQLDLEMLGDVTLAAAIDAIVALGKAQPGDKTMLDALGPALAALRDPANRTVPVVDRYRAAATAAERGSDGTIPLVARKGRASYLGDRSVGHRDPGAASAALLVRCLAQAVADRA